MRGLWPQLSELFETDGGSLPDIFVENLTSVEVRAIYHWVRTLSHIYRDPTVWDPEQQCDVPIKFPDDPAQLVTAGRVEPFRHGLTPFSFAGVRLPQLTVSVSPDQIEFDYRMGAEWGPSRVTAMSELLWLIQQMSPAARVSHSYEGEAERTPSFARAWLEFARDKRAT